MNWINYSRSTRERRASSSWSFVFTRLDGARTERFQLPSSEFTNYKQRWLNCSSGLIVSVCWWASFRPQSSSVRAKRFASSAGWAFGGGGSQSKMVRCWRLCQTSWLEAASTHIVWPVYRLLIVLVHGWSGLLIPRLLCAIGNTQWSGRVKTHDCVLYPPWGVCVMSSQPIWSINSHQHAESISEPGWVCCFHVCWTKHLQILPPLSLHWVQI